VPARQFTPDSNTLATASTDGTAMLWNLTGLNHLRGTTRWSGPASSPDTVSIVTSGSSTGRGCSTRTPAPPDGGRRPCSGGDHAADAVAEVGPIGEARVGFGEVARGR